MERGTHFPAGYWALHTGRYRSGIYIALEQPPGLFRRLFFRLFLGVRWELVPPHHAIVFNP